MLCVMASTVEELQVEVADLKKLLETVVEENQVMKQEISELRTCVRCELVHQSEMQTFKKDMERLKKTQPDLNHGKLSDTSPSSDIYTRVKGLKRRPQSVHDFSIIPQSIQGQLLANKMQENGSNDRNGVGEHFQGAQPTFYFTLYNYDHCKVNKLKWFSESFYSHCYGYKMCIGVDVAGEGVGDGSHISLNVYLLPGEYDDSLQWPFRGTVRIKLFNEIKDINHFEAAVEFKEDTPLINSARVRCSERSAGWGNPLFLPHSQLALDEATDCELLKHDRLRFAVTEVETSH